MKHVVAVIVLGLAAVGCSSSTSTTTPQPSGTPTSSSPASSAAKADVTVQANDQRKFDPDKVTVKVGQSVGWKNSGSLPHTVTFDDGPKFDETLGDSGINRTFDTAGAFGYHCKIHGASMSGTVVVQ
jgi:plastocyanin